MHEARWLVVLAAFAAFFVPAAAAAALAAPTNLHVTGQTQTSISTAWSGSTTRYAVWLDGAPLTRVNAHSYTYTGLACGSQHVLGVRSVKGSQVSALVTITGSTLACTPPPPGGAPPPAGGYFTLAPVGAVLPSGSTCATAVHSSTWEPRPDNYKRNHVLVNAAAAHASFAARQRSSLGTYDPRWDSYLLPRVDGQYSGTTDEVFQWAACKWGLPDDLVRAVAYRESTWYQYETYPSGRCVDMYGCGDWFGSEPYAARNTYCDGIAAYGYDYQVDYGDALCPKTWSIIGEMAWWSPSWGFNYAGNQNGTFPFSRDSTAFAVDYYAGVLRGCFEGWQWEFSGSYAAGDLYGCVGAWYSGGWHDAAGDGYAQRVRDSMTATPWLDPGFPSDRPACSPTYGCPGPDGL